MPQKNDRRSQPTADALRKKLESLDAAGLDTAEKVDVLNALAEELALALTQEAEEFAKRALKLSKQLGYEKGQANALALIGLMSFFYSDLESATEYASRAVPLFEKIGDAYGRARALSVVAGAELSMGNYDTAFATSFDVLPTLREVGDNTMVGWVLNGVATAFQELGDYERAVQYHLQTRQIFEDLGHDVGLARALNGIGLAYQSMGKHDEAREYHERSLDLFRKAKMTSVKHERSTISDFFTSVRETWMRLSSCTAAAWSYETRRRTSKRGARA